MGISNEQAVQEIRLAIHQVVGPEWAQEMEIEAGTSLSEGIELDSIEIAKVIELMFKKFPGVDFESWFKRMTMESIVGLTVGDIAQFIAADVA
ncbi:hypothetical protein F2P44_32530 [Massilia sp. CCM 8695]|uniref:Acyl carrier protein n=2 Tax=Massilia TaxID=149698 RepID=A0AA49A5W3_9BURK|nr:MULTISPECIES: hypothetical protein [Massilia]NHZ83956.1 hypothetical protein [Massilia frigida]QPI47853.1 hypothetical protein IV454_20045 [Massilia antarctica]